MMKNTVVTHLVRGTC